MAEIKSVTVHCPSCLKEFEITPVVKSIIRFKSEGLTLFSNPPGVLVQFEDLTINHRCEKDNDEQRKP